MKKINIYADTLGEVFGEWLIWGQAHQKGLKNFIIDNELDLLFAEKDFRDIIEGDAYLRPNTITFVQNLMPFKITAAELNELNKYVRITNKGSRAVEISEEAILKYTTDVIIKKAKTQKREYDQEYYKRNRDKKRKASTEWVKENREKANEYARNHRANNRERYSELDLERRMKKRDAINKRGRERYNENQEKMREYAQKRYIRDRDRLLARTNAYHAKQRQKRIGPDVLNVVNSILAHKQAFGEKIARKDQGEIDAARTKERREKQNAIYRNYKKNNTEKVIAAVKRQDSIRRFRTKTGNTILSFLEDIIQHKEQYGENIPLKQESELPKEYLEKRKRAEANKLRWQREKLKASQQKKTR